MITWEGFANCCQRLKICNPCNWWCPRDTLEADKRCIVNIIHCSSSNLFFFKGRVLRRPELWLCRDYCSDRLKAPQGRWLSAGFLSGSHPASLKQGYGVPGLPMGVGRGRREGARSPPPPPCPSFGLRVHRPNCQSTCRHVLQRLACGMGLIVTKISHLLCSLACFFPLFEAPILILIVFALNSEMHCFALWSQYESFQSLSHYAIERESDLVKTALIPV